MIYCYEKKKTEDGAMTEKLYYQDAYETAFRAKVLDCQKEKEHFLVTLDRTYFYPEGGEIGRAHV